MFFGMFSCIQQRAYVSSLLKRNQKKKRELKKKEKKREKDDKSEEGLPPGESYCDSLESNFHVSEVPLSGCQAKIRFLRAGEGPKLYTRKTSSGPLRIGEGPVLRPFRDLSCVASGW